MFYETDRIVRKQQKYEKIRAYALIDEQKSNGLSDAEIIASIDVLLGGKNNEFQVGVLRLAREILKFKGENCETLDNGTDDDDSGLRPGSVHETIQLQASYQ
jgi:hypothetical protein